MNMTLFELGREDFAKGHVRTAYITDRAAGYDAAERDRRVAERDLLLANLKAIARRIDEGSGTASWTADEHDALLAIIAMSEGR